MSLTESVRSLLVTDVQDLFMRRSRGIAMPTAAFSEEEKTERETSPHRLGHFFKQSSSRYATTGVEDILNSQGDIPDHDDGNSFCQKRQKVA